MPEQTEPAVPAAPVVDVVATITSWLPDHTHRVAPAPFSSEWSWAWSTTNGVWRIKRERSLLGINTLLLSGPGVCLSITTGDIARSLPRLHGILVALEAIAAPALNAAERKVVDAAIAWVRSTDDGATDVLVREVELAVAAIEEAGNV